MKIAIYVKKKIKQGKQTRLSDCTKPPLSQVRYPIHSDDRLKEGGWPGAIFCKPAWIAINTTQLNCFELQSKIL